MSLTSLIQVLKVNEKRSGRSKEGRDWEMQDAECALLDDAGVLQQVGVLPLPKHMMGDAAPVPGTYMGAFALQAALKDRRIGAVLIELRPYDTARKVAAPAAPAKAAA